MSVSMYLMMDHNQVQYVKFLKLIKFFRLHWICCKWRMLVIDQLEAIQANERNEDEEVEVIMTEYHQNAQHRISKTEANDTNTENAMSQIIAK